MNTCLTSPRSELRRLTVPLLALVAAMGCAARASAAADTNSPPDSAPIRRLARTREAILFRNGDLLYGALDSILPASVVRWRHPDAQEPIEFRPDSVTEIHFPVRARANPHTQNSCRLQLSNSDQLEGDLLISDNEKAVLQTWYAGEVTIPHKLIQAVVPVPAEGAVV